MKKLLLASCLLLAVQLSRAQGNITDKRLASLDTALQRVLKTWKGAGFAVAVVEKNRIIYAKGFGYRDVEKKLPVTPNTLFAIGSCTKAFTTSLIGLLQKDGKLDIDKPAHQYWNELQFFTPELTNGITLRDMMSHRTGLPRHDYSWYLFADTSRETLARRIQFQEPTFPLRRQWQYNNFMFIAQGVIAEKVTGKSWEQNTRERLLLPLGMKASNFSVKELERHPDAAFGYDLKKDSVIKKLPYFNLDAAGPAGTINSNVLEMGNWLIAWINGGKYNGKQVLDENFSREAMSSQTVVGSGFPGKEKPAIHFSNYGFGWALSSYKGHYRVEHGGNIDGFSANTAFFPTDSIGIVVLVNQNSSSIPNIVRNLIADRMLQLPYFNWNDDIRNGFIKSRQQSLDAEKAKVSAQVKGTRPSHALQDYEGVYSHPGYGSMEVFLKNDSLLATAAGKLFWLKHYHYDIFSMNWMDADRYDPDQESNVRAQFITGVSGEIESFNAIGLEAPSLKLNFVRKPREKAVATSELDQYAGTYGIANVEVRIFVKDKKLRMFVPEQPEYELIPTGDHKFSIEDLPGYSVQFLKEGQKIVAVNLIQPNGTFRADKKQ